MTASLSKRWSLFLIGIVALIAISVFVVWRTNSDLPASGRELLDLVMISAGEVVTGERSEPTPMARPFLKANLGSEVEALLAIAAAEKYSTYEEFPETEWPPAIQRLKPAAVVYFDSKSMPDGAGVIILVERYGEWDMGILFSQLRNSEWQGVHLDGHVMRAGPEYGFRRLKKDGVFWHWYKRNWASTQQGGPVPE